jgi:hypothetical protein
MLQGKGGENMAKTREVGRDARTGQFVPIRETERRPATTVKETVPVPKPKKK